MGIGFAHLHVHNEYSQLDGMGTATQYAERAKELGFESLALTNHGNVDGLIQFQRACDKVGVNPIAGCELYVVPDRHRKEKGEKRGHATVLVKNHAGFENLMQMLTVANLEGFYYKPRVDYETMLKHLEGLVLLTGCSDSFLFSHKPDNGKLDDMFLDLIRKEDTYVEIMPHDIEQERRVVEWWLKNGVSPVPFVATNDCHYVMEDDWESQEVLLAMQRKAKWSDKDRWRFNIKGLHLRSAEEMFQAFRAQGILDNWQIRDAMERTVEVAEKCAGFRIEKQRMFLPTPPDYVGKDANEELWRLCEVACEGRPEAYWDRLNEEMDLIEGKGFSRYFLIVYELANWCRRNDVMVGPGRGSVGGSLMAYLLGITTVDPLRFDLLFSRFISQDRIDYPDIDLDFEDRKRHLVIQHLEDLYGRNNVANIATFLRMKAKMVVRDVARVFEIPLKDVDEFAKSIEDGDAHDTDRISRFVKSKEGRGFARKYPDVVRHASRLEGQVRGYGTHAAGIIVSGEDLRGGTKCNLISPSGNVSINWEMGDSEYMGLMKLDILGLNTLSVLSECRRLILENHGDQLATHPESDCCFVCRKENLTDQVEYLGEFDFPNLPLDDPKVYKELSAGNTHGTFQFTGYACTELIKRMCVSNFEDLVQAISLARPGPADSGMTDLFVKRKHGEKWSRKHDTFEDVTKDTYGVVVYQEQVMNVIHKVAGLPYETADKIRKVIGKKRDAKEFAPFKEAFIQGCRKQKTFTDQEAEDFWVELQNHAHYSFNRSHAVEYAMIGYWTAWVKFRYPTEFLCASLTYEGDSKKPGLVKEAYRLGLQVVPPKVGISDAIKWIARGNRLYVPFKEVKGIGEKTALQAVEIKKSVRPGFFGPVDVYKDSKGAGKKVGKLLERIDAFDPTSIPSGLDDLFPFEIKNNPTVMYPNLFRLFPTLRPSAAERAVEGNYRGDGIFKKVRFQNPHIANCANCSLRGEATRTVLPSKGLWNIAIVGEAPGPDEDREGKGFVGKSGDALWDELGKCGLNRYLFHITNACKCFPSVTKTPGKEHIKACSRWLDEELERIECRVALVFGNTGLMAFTGQSGGITAKSGKTEWLDRHRLWACWCLHPAAMLHNARNRDAFEKGILNFVDTLKNLGVEEILW